MPVLANPRHELFAQEVAKGTDCAEAFVIAGFKNNPGNARRLKLNEAVAKRIEAIQLERAEISAKINAKAVERAAEALAIDKEWIMGRLKENAERAMQAVQAKGPDGQPVGDFKYDGSVANRALELLGKEIGMFIDRTENKTILHTIASDPMPEEEWAATHATAH